MDGKVYLVGAGPGDPDLITVKGMRCVQEADVILYDRLVNPDLLAHAKKTAKLVYCGKLPNEHTMPQEMINHLLLKYANDGLQVVRLKGGDPLVFGRGGEEAIACSQQGVPFEIVPGITSGMAAPAYAGIPLTHRKLSQSVAFITGHQADGAAAEHKWSHLVQGVDTLCIYMGVGNLEEIVHQFIRHGKHPQTPIALIHWGTRRDQQMVAGTLETIAWQAKEAKITSPSMIVVGEVVRLHHQMGWFQKQIVPHMLALI